MPFEFLLPMSTSHRDVNTYSPDGRIIQVEYAMKATDLGTTTIGAKLRDCVILVSEKKITNSLQVPESIKKHFKVSDRIVTGVSGVSSDVPGVLNKLRSKAMSHFSINNEEIPVKKLVNHICKLALQFGERDPADKIYDRPFGVSFLIASYDNEPKLFKVDPSGAYVEYKAHCIGSARETVEQMLEAGYEPTKGRDETLRWLLGILKNAVKEGATPYNTQVSIVDRNGVLMLKPEQIANYI